jgi:hypothetical protein
MVNDRTGSNRVIRGGSWDNDAANCRTANRNNDTPTNRNTNIGFRLALAPSRTRDTSSGFWIESPREMAATLDCVVLQGKCVLGYPKEQIIFQSGLALLWPAKSQPETAWC